MKICVVSYHSSPLDPAGIGKSGGMNVFISHLYQTLAQFCEIDIFVCGRKGRVSIGPGVQVIHIGYQNFADFTDEIIAYHNSQQYNLIHTHYWISGMIGLLAARTMRIPWVHSLHTFEVLKSIKRDKSRIEVEEEIIRRCDALISPTKQEARAIKEINPRARVITIPHGVDIHKFRPSTDGHSTLLYVGRIDPIKGLDLLIDAVRLLKRDVELNIIGGPSKGQDNLTSTKTYANGLPIRFLGPVKYDELYQHYNRASMIVIPSYYESFGLVALEAMASGRPVIGFADTGISETVGTDAGILVKRNVRNLVQAINDLSNNQGLRHTLGANGRAKALYYEWKRIARKYLTTYEEIIKGHTHHNGSPR